MTVYLYTCDLCSADILYKRPRGKNQAIMQCTECIRKKNLERKKRNYAANKGSYADFETREGLIYTELQKLVARTKWSELSERDYDYPEAQGT